MFVYGTLRDPDLRRAVAGISGDVTPAMLRGRRVIGGLSSSTPFDKMVSP